MSEVMINWCISLAIVITTIVGLSAGATLAVAIKAFFTLLGFFVFISFLFKILLDYLNL